MGANHSVEVDARETPALFRLLDVNEDNVISFEEWQAGFERLDENKDDTVSRKEWFLIAGENALFDAIDKKHAAMMTKSDWDAAFELLDEDKNGFISLDEFFPPGVPGNAQFLKDVMKANESIVQANGARKVRHTLRPIVKLGPLLPSMGSYTGPAMGYGGTQRLEAKVAEHNQNIFDIIPEDVKDAVMDVVADQLDPVNLGEKVAKNLMGKVAQVNTLAAFDFVAARAAIFGVTDAASAAAPGLIARTAFGASAAVASAGAIGIADVAGTMAAQGVAQAAGGSDMVQAEAARAGGISSTMVTGAALGAYAGGPMGAAAGTSVAAALWTVGKVVDYGVDAAWIRLRNNTQQVPVSLEVGQELLPDKEDDLYKLGITGIKVFKAKFPVFGQYMVGVNHYQKLFVNFLAEDGKSLGWKHWQFPGQAYFHGMQFNAEGGRITLLEVIPLG